MNYKWIVLFLVHAANKQTREHAKDLFKILESTQYNEEIKVLILYGALQSSEDEGFRIQVTLKEIIKDKATDLPGFSEIVTGYGAIDIGDDKNLSKIFSGIREKYPSKRFLLFTWDHGSGFGIFKTNPAERRLHNGGTLDFEMDARNNKYGGGLNISDENREFDIITNRSSGGGVATRDLGNTRGIEKKKIKTSMLTNDELRNILKAGADAKKVDLLIMMNCAMQMIETGYALHDAVEYLIAPETCIFWAGYDYKAIINKLCTDPEIETEAIGKYAIDTIKAYYYKTPCRKYFDDLVVSLVKPAKSIAVKKLIDETAGHLNNELADSFNFIKAGRHKCEDLTAKYVGGTPYHYIDFINYVSVMGPQPGKSGLEKIKAVVQEYVVHLIKGNNYDKMNEDGTGLVNGFTIYYPPSSKDADADYYYEWFYKEGDQQSLFADQSDWKSFLINYMRYDRKMSKKNNNS